MSKPTKISEAQKLAAYKYIRSQERCFIKIPMSVYNSFINLWSQYEDTDTKASVNGAIKALLSGFYLNENIQKRILEDDNVYERYAWSRDEELKQINLVLPAGTKLRVYNLHVDDDYKIKTTMNNWEKELIKQGNPIPNTVKLLIGDFIAHSEEWNETLEQVFINRRLYHFTNQKKEDPNEEYRASGLPRFVVNQIREIAKECKVTNLRLFGSRADGTFKKKSNINLSITSGDIQLFKTLLDDNVDTLLPFVIVNEKEVDEDLKSAIKKGILL